MNTKNAVAERIIKLCNQKNIAINALANISGISPSTLYSVLNEKSQNPGIVTLKMLCDGLDISLVKFLIQMNSAVWNMRYNKWKRGLSH